MTDKPQSPQNRQNSQNKKNKRWRRFRGKKNRPQGFNPQSQQNQNPQQKPSDRPSQVNRSPSSQSPKKPPMSAEPVKRSFAHEVLPPDYKLPEDLDIPSYTFSEISSTEEKSPSVAPEDNGEITQNVCPICNYPIKKFYTTVRHPLHDKLVHFDCALREIFQQYKTKLARDQRIYYIGAGRFAIVKEIRDKRGNVTSYQIIEKIEYEKNS
ncbi:hypothetical protein [Thermospira aquatica]|uniref:Serine/threonine protein kinase n=1 Tax=Thermospira aquatica TaxID=2828656 RepID=A0AAX3BFP5_9SPIR|nr:hypothetical protein [Thermospira aquatica]URA11066.1 hypothetical protein KDW03_04490 [Thermospira aquatica]